MKEPLKALMQTIGDLFGQGERGLWKDDMDHPLHVPPGRSAVPQIQPTAGRVQSFRGYAVSDALEKSIKHWEENTAATDFSKVDMGAGSCRLCLEYHQCNGCPVMKKTGLLLCGGSPYYRASEAYFAWRRNPSDPDLRDKFRYAAQKEVDFLKSLRKV